MQSLPRTAASPHTRALTPAATFGYNPFADAERHTDNRRMTPLDIFLNRHERLRSGWRFAIFCALYYIAATALFTLVYALPYLFAHATRAQVNARLGGGLGYLAQFLLMFVPAVLLGWACGRWFDGVPLRAQGWTSYRGWQRDFLYGSVGGMLALLLAALIATIGGGLQLGAGVPLLSYAFVKMFVGTAGVYTLLAAGEEALFRGYSLQTLLRSLPFLIAVLPSSVFFAAGHFFNPNVPHDYKLAIQFINTALAGIWLAVGYWRTRSMWLPLGLHWAWNWTMGSVLGLPVSGITSLTHAPLVRATDRGPAWLTGGGYGLEGGLACTGALVIAIFFLWRTRLLKPAAELKRYTDGEQAQATVQVDAAEPPLSQIV